MTKNETETKKPRAARRDGTAIANDLEARLAKIRMKNKLEGTPGLRALKSVQVSLLLVRGQVKGREYEPEVEALIQSIDALVKKLEA
jgi:hypothetical protein